MATSANTPIRPAPARASNSTARRCRGFIRLPADQSFSRSGSVPNDRRCSCVPTGPTAKMSLGPGPKMGPRTHEYPGLRSYILARDPAAPGRPDHPRAHGRDARRWSPSGCCSSRSGARRSSPPRRRRPRMPRRSAAAKDVKQQLLEQVATTGTSNLALINPVRVRAAAEIYAQRNKAPRDASSTAAASTSRSGSRRTPSSARAPSSIDQEDTRGEAAPARGSTLIAIPGAGGSAATSAATAAASDDQGQGVGRRSRRDLATRRRAAVGAVQRPRQARRAAARARLRGRRERRGRATTRRRRPLRQPATTTSAATPARSTSTPTTGPVRRSRSIDGDRRRRPGARLPHDLAGRRATRPHPHRPRQLGRDRRRRRHRRRRRRARGDRARGQADRLGRLLPAVRRARRPGVRRLLRRPARPGRREGDLPARSTARTRSPKVRLAAFETAIVESGVHNLNYGDRDSIGVFQQRPVAGLGHRLHDHGPRAAPRASSSAAAIAHQQRRA